MKNNFLIILILLTGFIALNSCDSQNGENKNGEDTTNFVEEEYNNATTFYQTEKDANALLIANPITYGVIVKNPNPHDEWTDSCLQNFDKEAFINIVLQTVYSGRLTPYNYLDDKPVKISEVKEFETNLKENGLGKVYFTEEWYFDEEKLQMTKIVKSITLGYELRNDLDEIYGYKALFVIHLDENNENGTEIEAN